MSKQDEMDMLPKPYSVWECYFYYMATGKIPDQMPRQQWNRMQKYLDFIAKYGMSASSGEVIAPTIKLVLLQQEKQEARQRQKLQAVMATTP